VTEDMIFAEAARPAWSVNKLKVDMKDPVESKRRSRPASTSRIRSAWTAPHLPVHGKLRPGAVDDDTLAEAMKASAGLLVPALFVRCRYSPRRSRTFCTHRSLPTLSLATLLRNQILRAK
jgi:hypothetical protein